MCLNDLEKVKNLDSPYLTQLKTDLPPDGSTFKGQHLITRSNFNLKAITDEFVDSLVSNIKARYLLII